MKYAILQVVVLTTVVAASVAAGHGSVADWWGPPGVTALRAAAIICLIGAVLGAVPLAIVATYWRQHAPMTAFAGTAIRLLVTGALSLGYQSFAQPALTPFLTCLLVIYLLLLLAETALIVYIVRCVLAKPTPKSE